LSGDVDANEDLVTFTRAISAASAARSNKTVVLTEGVTDSRILAVSLTLLHPHPADYYSFMDFEAARVGGGAGNPANLVKAFAGIVNRITVQLKRCHDIQGPTLALRRCCVGRAPYGHG